jgi:hypothetical protein
MSTPLIRIPSIPVSGSSIMSVDSASQDPELLRRLLRAKDRMDAASHEDWPVQRLARVSIAEEGAGSSGQRHARDLGADRDEAILQCRIVGLRIRLHTPQVIKIFPGHL